MMWWGGNDGWAWGWGMGILHNFLWWVLVILGIVVLVRLLAGRQRSVEPPSETALEVLKKRYVRGELSKEEFEQKKRDIAA